MSKILINENGKALMSADGKVYKTEPIDTLEALCNDTLTSYSNSNITNIRAYLFYGCKILEEVSIPNATVVGQEAFKACNKLISVNIPNVEILWNGIFYYCNSLKSLRFIFARSIYANVFYNCSSLTDIYLGANQLVTLGNKSAFTNVTSGLKIHVRPEYADQYTDATNWSSLIADGTIVIVGDYSD